MRPTTAQCTLCGTKKKKHRSQLVIDLPDGRRARVLVFTCPKCDKNEYPPPKIEKYVEYWSNRE